ncbi:MAG: FKBP-type peptidyl-prolyl cis-trans isomerase [Imperialibacter sp.]|uniref:FKBP-type peptidyl-prolyl cis-trans isomerase n=1 Tax=Imperialibacter sp. TaxID=2038411 RepID=UPI0032EEBE60
MIFRVRTAAVILFVATLAASLASCDLSVDEPDPVFDVEAQYKKDSIAIDEYLAKYGIEGVQTTESGLRYKVLEEGSGPAPNKNDIVSVHFTISRMDSAVIETTFTDVALKYNIYDSAIAYVPYKFNFGGGFVFENTFLVAGLREGSQLMKLNDRYVFYLPSKLAFGQVAYGQIPANSPSVWELKMVQIR